MSSSEDDLKNSARNYFIRNKYNGDRSLWRKFRDECFTAIRSKRFLGTRAIDFFIGYWIWDEEHEQWVDLPEDDFQILPIPALIHDGTAQQKRDNRNGIKFIKDRNEVILYYAGLNWKRRTVMSI